MQTPLRLGSSFVYLFLCYYEIVNSFLLLCLQLFIDVIIAPFLQYGSHSKKRPNNLVIARTYNQHIYDMVEVGIENFKSMHSFAYDKKLSPRVGSKPFITFIGEGFENVEELKHLKEVLLDFFRGEVKTLQL